VGKYCKANRGNLRELEALNSDSLKLYMNVRPVGIQGAARLYTSYAASFVMELLFPNRFKSTGYLIPGRSRLRVTFEGIRTDVSPRTNNLAIIAGVHEPKTTTWFHVSQGETVVDVGAHIGRYTLIAAKTASRVISIEPEPTNFSLLQDNIKLNNFTNVIALQVALSNKKSRKKFYVAGGGDTGTSSLQQDFSWRLDLGVMRKAVEVETQTLDSIVDSLEIRAIDWLKIDVEGHEVQVLEGGGQTLARTRKLILEVAEGNEEACKGLVRYAGFETVAVEEGKREAGLRASSNWLLVHKNPVVS